MKTPDIEGVAIHDGPESCIGACEGDGEAVTGYVRASHCAAKSQLRDADVVSRDGRQHHRRR